jgi:hypothetical protein
MIVISHRGNINGPDKQRENTVSAIDEVIKMGHLCEVDVWKMNDQLFLSHDLPDKDQKSTEFDYFRARRSNLAIHCKNIEALQFFQGRHEDSFNSFNYFWHENDRYTLTSYGWVWAYPGQNVNKNERGVAVAVMPEIVDNFKIDNFNAVCTDFVTKYKS